MKPKFFKIQPISSYGTVLVCPHCQGRLGLVDIKDGDQAHWCYQCEVGWRIGHMPDTARLEKRKLNDVKHQVIQVDEGHLFAIPTRSVQSKILEAFPRVDKNKRLKIRKTAPSAQSLLF